MIEWESAAWKDCFVLSGYIVTTSENASQRARDTVGSNFAAMKDSFPAGTFESIANASDIRRQVPQLKGPMEGWKGYYNKYAGYAQATKAVKNTVTMCKEKGVLFVTGQDGNATELLYEKLGSKEVCKGVKTASGVVHFADTTILCMGAYVGHILPAIAAQITAKCWPRSTYTTHPSRSSIHGEDACYQLPRSRDFLRARPRNAFA